MAEPLSRAELEELRDLSDAYEAARAAHNAMDDGLGKQLMLDYARRLLDQLEATEAERDELLCDRVRYIGERRLAIAAAVEAEREACANVAEVGMIDLCPDCTTPERTANHVRNHVARAIRARSTVSGHGSDTVSDGDPCNPPR
jgi:hypothetical protein